MEQDDLNWKLFHAAENNNIAGVREALFLGADVNTVNNPGVPVLVWACWCGYTEITRLLIEHGADINKKNKDKRTALIMACWDNNKTTAVLLLEYNAVHSREFIRE